jgi:hypothetical protein
MKPIDIFLTKEAFEQYAIRLREEKAREYGMTLEEWDTAVATQQVVSPNTQPNNISGSKTT